MNAGRVLLLATLCFSAACGGYGRRLPADVIKKLPYESRIELLEAENELAIAIDRVDEAQNEIDRSRTNIRRGKDRLSAAEGEVGRAKDGAGREVAKLAVVEAEARVEYLRRRQDVNVEMKGIQELALQCAYARFELERVRIAKKSKVQGSEGIATADFERQVQGCEADVARRRQALKPDQQRAVAAKNQWDERRAQLGAKTFDARASPFVE